MFLQIILRLGPMLSLFFFLKEIKQNEPKQQNHFKIQKLLEDCE
jgi:hypothetical protein